VLQLQQVAARIEQLDLRDVARREPLIFVPARERRDRALPAFLRRSHVIAVRERVQQTHRTCLRRRALLQREHLRVLQRSGITELRELAPEVIVQACEPILPDELWQLLGPRLKRLQL
jgi:hypothetical protein